MDDDTKRKTWKRKKRFGEKKLLAGDQVEVRQFDRGLQGSWFLGVVIKSEELSRHVEYADLFSDGDSSKLIEAISVSPSVDGVLPTKTTKAGRGKIRPLPPHSHRKSSTLCYGLCVDALVDHAWWEGVIFDQEEGARTRLIFFPDEGDQAMIDVEELRVSQDWDEVLGGWKHRGEWLFLDLLREIMHWRSLPVSVRQIWYDARANAFFRGEDLDWTCRDKYFWKKLILEAIQENEIVAGGGTCSLPDFVSKENLAACKRRKKTTELLVLDSGMGLEAQMDASSMQTSDGWNKAEENLAFGQKRSETLISQISARTGVPQLQIEDPFTHSEDGCIGKGNQICQSNLVSKYGMNAATSDHGVMAKLTNSTDGQKDGNQKIQSAPTEWSYSDKFASGKHLANEVCKTRKNCIVQSSICTSFPRDEMVDYDFQQRLQSSNDYGAQENHLCLTATACENDIQDFSLNASKEVLSMAEYFPDAVSKYFTFSSKNKSPSLKNMLAEKVKHHLSFSGQKLEFRQGKEYVQNCHSSPVGKVYPSLHTACTYLKEQEVNVPSSANADGHTVNYSNCKYDASSVARANPGPACLIQESVENSRVTGTNLYKEEHSSRNAEPSFASKDTKAKSIQQGTGQVTLLPEILDEEQDADFGPLVEENHTCGSLEPEISLVFGSEYSPEAVRYYYLNCIPTGKFKQNGSSEDMRKIRLKVRMHLLADGWKIWYVYRGKKRELRYGQPNGRCFSSLRTACKAWIEGSGISSRPTVGPTCEVNSSKRSKGPLVDEKANNCVNTASTCFKLQRSKSFHESPWGGAAWSSGLSLSSRPGSSPLRLTQARKCQKRRNYSSSSVSQQLPCEMNANLLSCSAMAENIKPSGQSILCGKTAKSSSAARNMRRRRSHGGSPMNVLQSSKRSPQVLLPFSSQHGVRSILTWLIDNDVVLPRQKVHYIHAKDHCVSAEGWITREGIKCKCCKKVYGLTSFELHAGSCNHCPAAHIFLEDGRSLLECQIQLVHCGNLKGLGSDMGPRMKRDCSNCKTDDICSICHYGGNLLLCDYCPSSFHLNCINLKEVPGGSWACPTCRCGICGKSDFNGNSEQFTEKTVLYCDQCEHEYHVGCLRKRSMTGLERCPDGNWFCSSKCSKIFMHIQKIVGKRKQTDIPGLSWTLLRPTKDVNCALDALKAEDVVELHSKLSIALSILHECFVPITEPRTKRDLVTDVVFNQGSELKRLNFRGFYTMVLERGDELISVATFRIHGVKVAELPLIGTCVQYRQQGMCHLLMNELEKMLSELGVERLLLPATSQMLPKWISSFGFAQMTPVERVEFLQYTFLDFQGTCMCQKVLQTTIVKAPKSIPGGRNNAWDVLSQNTEGMESGKHSGTSEITQIVSPVAALLSIDAEVQRPLHDEIGTGEEIMGDSSSSTGRSCTEVLSQEQNPQMNIMVKQALIEFTAGEGSTNPGFLETFLMIDVLKQKSEKQSKLFDLCYQRKRNLDKCGEKGNAAGSSGKHINRFVNQYKRQRILTHKVSSIQSTV